MIYLRSSLFYLGMILSLLVFAFVQPFCLLFPFHIRYMILTRWGRFIIWWLRLTCHLDYRVEGAENIPAGPAVVLAKHQSAWETIALQRILPPQTWVLKRELLWIPFFGWGLALLNAVAIDRGAGRKALKQVVEKGTERLKQGIWIIVFPEGTRVAPGTKGNYNIGGAMLAQKSGYPVLPVAHNAGEYWPKQGFLKYPGTITVAIGPVIETSGIKPGDINARAESWIEDKMCEISGVPHTE